MIGVYMQEKNLLRYAFIGCIIGIVLLFFLSQIKKDEMANSFQERDDGKIHFLARIMQITKGNNVLILKVKNEEEIKVLLFKPDTFFAQKGSLVEITGTKQID